MSWREITLGDEIEIKHGFAFKSQYYADTGPYVLLTPGNCFERGGLKLKGAKEKYYIGIIPDEFVLSTDDLIVVMTDLVSTAPILGGAFLIPEDDKFLHNQRLGLVRFKSDNLDRRFLYFLLNTQSYRAQVRGSASGATVRHTAPKRIYQCKVRIPDKATQIHIANILSAYDDLIENNRRRIALLDQATRELYREWFVRLRFPGHEKTRIVDGLPERWERKKIADVCRTTGGGTPSTKRTEYWDGDITWVVPTDVTNNDCLVLLDSARKITDKGLRESSAKMVPAETILMTSRASVGFFAIMDREVCTNQGFINVVPNDEKIRLYFLFNLINRVPEIRSNAQGTTYPEISKGRFREMDIVIPTRAIVTEFSRRASEVIDQVRCLKRSTTALTQARDILLPRLMSGEVTV